MSPLKPLDAKALTHTPPDRTPRRTIGGKLNRLVIVSVGVALLLGGMLSCWLEAQRFLQSKRDVMFATAQVFAAASSRAVAANDAPSPDCPDWSTSRCARVTALPSPTSVPANA